jgi:hypothetical protein
MVVVALFPSTVMYAAAAIRRVYHWSTDRRMPEETSREPIEQVAADLRRLRAQLEERENRPGASGKGLKMRAVQVAYVQALTTACDELGVRPPVAGSNGQVGQAELYRVEAGLRERGLEVSPMQRRRAA